MMGIRVPFYDADLPTSNDDYQLEFPDCDFLAPEHGVPLKAHEWTCPNELQGTKCNATFQTYFNGSALLVVEGIVVTRDTQIPKDGLAINMIVRSANNRVSASLAEIFNLHNLGVFSARRSFNNNNGL